MHAGFFFVLFNNCTGGVLEKFISILSWNPLKTLSHNFTVTLDHDISREFCWKWIFYIPPVYSLGPRLSSFQRKAHYWLFKKLLKRYSRAFKIFLRRMHLDIFPWCKSSFRCSYITKNLHFCVYFLNFIKLSS